MFDSLGSIRTRVLRRGTARRQRVAAVLPQLLDAAALDAVRARHGPFGYTGPLAVAVVGRIGVDDHALRAVLGGEVRLHAAEDLSVARQDDLARTLTPVRASVA